MVQEYKDMVEKIPAETRWAICAQALTGAWTGLQGLIQDLVGPEKTKEVVGKFMAVAAPGIKQLVDALGLPTHDLPAMANSLNAAVTLIYGPEMQIETLDSSPKKVVARMTGCPFPARMKETGITLDCLPICSVYFEAMWKALKPNAVVSAGDKSLARGDPYCGDRVVELPT